MLFITAKHRLTGKEKVVSWHCGEKAPFLAEYQITQFQADCDELVSLLNKVPESFNMKHSGYLSLVWTNKAASDLYYQFFGNWRG